MPQLKSGNILTNQILNTSETFWKVYNTQFGNHILSQYKDPTIENFSFNLLHVNKGSESLKIGTKKRILEKQFKL